MRKNSEKSKKAWPTEKAMTQIYENKLWGIGDSAFYSGEGSHDVSIVRPYVDAVTEFLKSFSNNLVVCDLGCGDFNIGRQLLPYASSYHAVDIVPSLIEFNRRQFQTENLDFHCLDIAKDELPKADCVILRQVLQHLSNNEVKLILDKLKQYKYAIITEHVPNGDFTPNIDIISGQGIRLKKASGVDVLREPFNLEVINAEVLSSIELANDKGKIVTKLYTLK